MNQATPARYLPTLLFAIPDNCSVHVEVAPNEPGRPGMVIIESKQCTATAKYAHMVSANLLLLSEPMVGYLLSTIVSRRCNNYLPVGEGCQYWLSTISRVEEGIIGEEASDAAIDAMEMYLLSPSGTPPVPRPTARGSFNVWK